MNAIITWTDGNGTHYAADRSDLQTDKQTGEPVNASPVIGTGLDSDAAFAAWVRGSINAA